jgi:hypothetical protein
MTFPIYGKKNVPNHQSVYYTNPLIHANVHVVYGINIYKPIIFGVPQKRFNTPRSVAIIELQQPPARKT